MQLAIACAGSAVFCDARLCERRGPALRAVCPRPDGEACIAAVGGLAVGASVADAARSPNLPGPGRSVGAPVFLLLPLVRLSCPRGDAIGARRLGAHARRADPRMGMTARSAGYQAFGRPRRARASAPCGAVRLRARATSPGALWCAGWGEGRAAKPFPHSGRPCPGVRASGAFWLRLVLRFRAALGPLDRLASGRSWCCVLDSAKVLSWPQFLRPLEVGPASVGRAPGPWDRQMIRADSIHVQHSTAG